VNLTRAAAAIAYGFLAASAIANFIFAFTLGKTLLLAFVYGSVGVLATAANAVIPLRMLQAWDVRRYSVLAAGAAFLPLCVVFSLTSAMGFAASLRDKATAEQAALSQNYKTTLAMLKDVEARPKTSKMEKRIEALRLEVKAYRERGAMKQDDPQSAALEILGITDGRYYLTLLFALLVEVGSALGLFIALADGKPAQEAAKSWKPKAA